jgi:hypothetical protein
VKDPEDAMFLTDRPVYGYRELPDNRQHPVVQGDTLYRLAGAYFAGMPRPAGYWWAIGDFQPAPIHDPTIRLPIGSIIVVPSLRTLQVEILNDRRRQATS